MKKSNLIGIAGLILIIVSIGVFTVKTSGYKDVDYLLNINESREVTVEGKVVDIHVDFDNNLVVFTLEGQSGARVIAYYNLDKFQSEYGGLPSHSTVDSKMVVSGLFIPVKSSIYIGEIQIRSILTGCHKAYEAPQVKKT
jgi:tRNA(Ile2) C34 agmatinyltransferase TiaS